MSLAPLVRVACLDLASGRPLVSDHDDEPCYAASTIKLAILVAAFRAADGGRLRLDQPVSVATRWPATDGSTFVLAPEDTDAELAARAGDEIVLSELMERMITVSSNEAANLVLEVLGFDEVERATAALGAGGLSLRHRFGDRRARAAGLGNLATASGLARLMAAVGRHEAASAPACRTMLDLLGRQQHRELIPSALPAGAACADKPGWADGVLHDVALVRPAGARAFCLAVCTSGFADPDVAAADIHRITRRCVEVTGLVGDPGSSAGESGSTGGGQGSIVGGGRPAAWGAR